MNALNRTFIIAAGLALSGIIVASLAFAGHSGSKEGRKVMIAKKLDANGDGMLSQDELLARNQIRFQNLDSNGDGTISPEEFSAQLTAMFSKLDIDGDGFLSKAEMPKRLRPHGHMHEGRHRHHHDASTAQRIPNTNHRGHTPDLSSILIPSEGHS